MLFSVLGDNFDFHCEDCCFILTLYPWTHVSLTIITDLIKFSSVSASYKRSAQSNLFFFSSSVMARNKFCGDMPYAQTMSQQ